MRTKIISGLVAVIMAITVSNIQISHWEKPTKDKEIVYFYDLMSEPEQIKVKELKSDIELVSLGTYRLTAYCPCERCCGSYANGITASGTVATAGRTIGVDPSVIPYGTKVIINGHEYIAEDTGGSIKANRIDVFFDDHDEALQFGVQYAEVFVESEVE